jgi:hypothetical protein
LFGNISLSPLSDRAKRMLGFTGLALIWVALSWLIAMALKAAINWMVYAMIGDPFEQFLFEEFYLPQSGDAWVFAAALAGASVIGAYVLLEERLPIWMQIQDDPSHDWELSR